MNVSARLLLRLLLVIVAVAAIAMTGCEKEAKPIESKEGGRIYLDGLFYQVQLSRQLNPNDVEDSFYLVDKPAPAAGEAYFGVFMRVDNEDTYHTVMPIGIEKMMIKSAAGREFEPIEVSAEGWGYEPEPIGQGARIPIPDTPASGGPIGGSLILFKLTYDDLDARPLELEIENAKGDIGTIVLDV